jgi:hypothetical protein
LRSLDHKLEVGDSFTLYNQYGEHLHIIVAESSPTDSASLMLVYLSSSEKFIDETTIIAPGEHEFVYKTDERTWIRYQNVFVCSRGDFVSQIQEYYGKVNGKLLERIQAGIEKSTKTSDANKSIYHQWRMDKLYRKMKN